MSARPTSCQTDPAAEGIFGRRPVAYCATLLVIAAVTISWTGFDIEPASARDEQGGAARQSTIAGVDARDLLDDPQREQPWLDQCVNPRNVAPTARADTLRSHAGE